MILPNYSYFLQIADCKSISRAAESLYISQPALTKYLRKLEEELGVQLFERRQGTLKITDAGQYFYEYVTRSLEDERVLRAKIAEIRTAGRATITIGMPLWRSSVTLPDFLPLFFERHPFISVRLFEGSASKLENALMNDTVDFCIMNLPVTYANVSYIPIVEEYIFLVGSCRNPLVQDLLREYPNDPHPAVPIQRFAQQPFILTQPGQHITEYINTMLSRNNMELSCLLRTSNVTTAVNMAASGLGFTFVPETGTHSRYFPGEDTALFTINDPPLRTTLATVYKRSGYLSAAAQLFTDELKEYIAACRAELEEGTVPSAEDK